MANAHKWCSRLYRLALRYARQAMWLYLWRKKHRIHFIFLQSICARNWSIWKGLFESTRESRLCTHTAIHNDRKTGKLQHILELSICLIDHARWLNMCVRSCVCVCARETETEDNCDCQMPWLQKMSKCLLCQFQQCQHDLFCMDIYIFSHRVIFVRAFNITLIKDCLRSALLAESWLQRRLNGMSVQNCHVSCGVSLWPRMSNHRPLIPFLLLHSFGLPSQPFFTVIVLIFNVVFLLLSFFYMP